METQTGTRMHWKPWILGFGVLLLLLLGTGQALAHGGHGPILYDQLDVRFIMPPGESGEVDFEMAQGEAIEWEVQAVEGPPVYVEVHSHGFEFQRHEVFNATTGQNGSFEAPFNGYFGVLVDHGGQGNGGDVQGAPGGTGADQTNEDPPVATESGQEVLVHLRIEGWFAVLGFVNIEPLTEEPPQESPGPGPLAVAGLAVAAVATALSRRR